MKALFTLLAASFIGLSIAAPAKTGKLVGHVEVGPISPVERPGHPAKIPPSVYKKYTVMVTQRGPHNGQMHSMLIRVIAQLKLSPTGDFKADLPPGEYQVGVETPVQLMTKPSQQTIKIVKGKTTKVTIKVDTGIR
ncbi:MAG TPA: hypothetical protein VHE55_09775 [Fimbriimonadaceae bacterium]|nr:hypothetical protein [Fimbriimonadaceae bacterium]